MEGVPLTPLYTPRGVVPYGSIFTYMIDTFQEPMISDIVSEMLDTVPSPLRLQLPTYPRRGSIIDGMWEWRGNRMTLLIIDGNRYLMGAIRSI